MVVDSIKKGIVIDHITAGRGMKLLEYLNVDLTLDSVAIIINAASKKNNRKDIIKIENRVDADLDVIGLVDPGATVNIIEDYSIIKKIKPQLPAKVENVIFCKNPRCVTSVERSINHVFTLTDPDNQEYRCIYCDETVSMKTE